MLSCWFLQRTSFRNMFIQTINEGIIPSVSGCLIVVGKKPYDSSWKNSVLDENKLVTVDAIFSARSHSSCCLQKFPLLFGAGDLKLQGLNKSTDLGRISITCFHKVNDVWNLWNLQRKHSCSYISCVAASSLPDGNSGSRMSRTDRTDAQNALFDYLHYTRCLNFTDAEHISKNSPVFLQSLLKKVNNGEEVGKSVSRFLRFTPINEFEPFFESIGLKPSEYNLLLPRELVFLSDIDELLNNYRDLYNYGIARNKIGKMYKEAKDMFMYEPGLLKSKLLAYEQLGLRKYTVIKLVASTPALLLGDVNSEFVLLLKNLEEIGLPRDWIGGIVYEQNSYYWGKMLVLLNFFKDMGFDEKRLGDLISKHPSFLFDGSGEAVFSVISLLLKMGVSRKEIFIMFSTFPHLQVGSFARNLRRAFHFLVEIEMDFEDIKNLIRHHKDTLSLFLLKKPTSIMTNLSSGKRRLCKIIIEDPHQLVKYAMGLKVPSLPSSGSDLKSIIGKKKFLSHLGFVENSKEMKSALKVFRGRGDELQDRFDFLVKSGLNPGDVLEMLRRAPHILNQKIEVLDEKLNFILNNLGYPLSSVVRFPQCISYTIERVKLRHLMYDWLKKRGKAKPSLALGSLIACSDQMFIKRFVNLHSDGPEAWENFKKSLSSN